MAIEPGPDPLDRAREAARHEEPAVWIELSGSIMSRVRATVAAVRAHPRLRPRRGHRARRRRLPHVGLLADPHHGAAHAPCSEPTLAPEAIDLVIEDERLRRVEVTLVCAYGTDLRRAGRGRPRRGARGGPRHPGTGPRVHPRQHRHRRLRRRGRRPQRGLAAALQQPGSSGGRPAACRRSGRWRSTAGSSRRSDTSRTMSPQTGHVSPVRPWTARWDFFSPLSSLAARPARALDRVAEDGADRVVQRLQLGVVEAVGGLERRHPRRVQQLVGVGVADAGDGALVAQHALDLRAAGASAGSRASTSMVNSSASGSGPSRAMPGTSQRVADDVHRQALLGARPR